MRLAPVTEPFTVRIVRTTNAVSIRPHSSALRIFQNAEVASQRDDARYPVRHPNSLTNTAASTFENGGSTFVVASSTYGSMKRRILVPSADKRVRTLLIFGGVGGGAGRLGQYRLQRQLAERLGDVAAGNEPSGKQRE